jgi:hypothetical protein
MAAARRGFSSARFHPESSKIVCQGRPIIFIVLHVVENAGLARVQNSAHPAAKF